MSGGSLFWNRNMIDFKELLELCVSLRSEGTKKTILNRLYNGG